MVLSVPPESWDEFEALCASEGVEATVIGQFTDTKRLILKYADTEVGNMDMAFLHYGRPPVVREAVFESRVKSQESRDAQSLRAMPCGFGDVLKSILSSLNVCSKEWIIRQYDHEVQAGSVVKPLVGVANDGPSDAAVVRPDLTSNRGLVISCGMNPHYGDHDPYWMAAAAIDEAVRNCVAVGADPSHIAILDNFCWGNTERPETLGSLVRAALGCQDTAVAFGTPFVSGKDSLNNEFTYGDQTISIPPSLLITALGQVADIRQCVTMDLKEPGNVLFLVGETKAEFGGSHFNLCREVTGGDVPQVNLKHAPKVFAAIHEAISTECVRSCHDLSEGGLAVAIAEMAFAGGLGADLSLNEFGKLDDLVVLFSESCTRFVVEVSEESADQYTELIEQRIGRRAVRLGTVAESDRLRIMSIEGNLLIDESIDDLKQCWQRPLDWK